MLGLNKCYFIGHLGRDPEMRATPGGHTVARLNLATPHVRKDGENWIDTPDWHRVTAFGKTAESIQRNAHKGDVIAVECVVRPNRWTDKDNQTHYEVNFYVERVLWVSQKRRLDAGCGAAYAEPIEADAAPVEEAGEGVPTAVLVEESGPTPELPF